jgi:hypothetical protein
MVKLVDTLDSGSSSARCAGSSPVPGTTTIKKPLISSVVFLFEKVPDPNELLSYLTEPCGLKSGGILIEQATTPYCCLPIPQRRLVFTMFRNLHRYNIKQPYIVQRAAAVARTVAPQQLRRNRSNCRRILYRYTATYATQEED